MTVRPRIGLLGIMQELYDEMIPGITEHQAAYAREVSAALAEVAEVEFIRPARSREDIEELVARHERDGVDGIAIVMLTYAPAMRSVPALTRTRLPLLLANIQPVRSVSADWTMDDLTYNQGVHGAQDQANALARSKRPLSILTGDWRSAAFTAAFGDWAHAARAVTKLASTRVALLGNPMNGMGDILADLNGLLRRTGVSVNAADIGELARRVEAVPEADIDALLAIHHERFEVSADLPTERHRYALALEVALREMLEAGDFSGFSFHFDSIAGDGRIRQLPLLAASDLMAEGYGFAAEGDISTATLMCAAHTLVGDAHFSEIYAMDHERDSVLISHMGEGNWAVARTDRPVRLIDRPLGIGKLENPPTPVFGARPGPATVAALVQLGGEEMRLVIGLGVVLDTPELPRVEMHHFHFRPCSGMPGFMDGWLRAGAPHHFVTTLGDDRPRWRHFAAALDLACVEV